MNIIGWLVFGLIVGAIAKLLMPGRDPGGWIVTILLGVAGSFVGPPRPAGTDGRLDRLHHRGDHSAVHLPADRRPAHRGLSPSYRPFIPAPRERGFFVSTR